MAKKVTIYKIPIIVASTLFFQFSDAVEMYREVLRSVDEHKDQLRTDSLQQLHAMHNLREVLSQKHSGIPPTLRDDQLLQQVSSSARTWPIFFY